MSSHGHDQLESYLFSTPVIHPPVDFLQAHMHACMPHAEHALPHAHPTVVFLQAHMHASTHACKHTCMHACPVLSMIKWKLTPKAQQATQCWESHFSGLLVRCASEVVKWNC